MKLNYVQIEVLIAYFLAKAANENKLVYSMKNISMISCVLNFCTIYFYIVRGYVCVYMIVYMLMLFKKMYTGRRKSFRREIIERIISSYHLSHLPVRAIKQFLS